MREDIEKIVEDFAESYREYLLASIRFAEIQEPYRPLSSEEDIKFLTGRLRTILQNL